MLATPTTGLMDHIGDVNNVWTLSAFAIAAILSVYNIAAKRGETHRTVWVIVAAICVIAIVPIIVDGNGHPAMYRVRVTALDPSGVPLEGVVIKTTATNAASTGNDGIGELAIPKASLQQDGKITIFADKPAAFLHGTQDVTLETDANPTVKIQLNKAQGTIVSGIVEDQDRHPVPGARVTIPGGDSTTTDADGNFKLPAQAAPGEEVELHVEKAGYTAVPQRHVAGRGPATLVVHRESRAHRKP